MRGNAVVSGTTAIDHNEGFGEFGGSKIKTEDGPCADCGGMFYHRSECSLDETRSSRWTGSEIPTEEAPCEVCGGVYLHSFDCTDDPYPNQKRQGRMSLTKATETCLLCYKPVNDHRPTCPKRAGAMKSCSKCNMYLSSAHTERMCLIRQASNRVRMSAKEAADALLGQKNTNDYKPCPACAGVVKHYWPCTEAILVNQKDVVL